MRKIALDGIKQAWKNFFKALIIGERDRSQLH